MINEAFVCGHCGQEITKHPSGSARNHCPFCLYSKHVDKDFPGDRASDCLHLMAPIGFEERKWRGLVVLHECTKCKKRIVNKIAPDDNYIPLYRQIARNAESWDTP